RRIQGGSRRGSSAPRPRRLRPAAGPGRRPGTERRGGGRRAAGRGSWRSSFDGRRGGSAEGGFGSSEIAVRRDPASASVDGGRGRRSGQGGLDGGAELARHAAQRGRGGVCGG